jgi:Fe2+ transport system protein FeoA
MRLSEEIAAVIKSLANRNGQTATAALKAAVASEQLAETLAECEEEGWLMREGGGEVELTDAGRALAEDISRRLIPADQLQPGAGGRVAYVSARDYTRFQKLASLGFAPGVPLKLRQRFPSFVIQVEETEIALEAEIARDIFVWRT